MRHIFHTCLLAIRLISGTAGKSTDTDNSMNFFDNSWMNTTFSLVYIEQGAQGRRSGKNTAHFQLVSESKV